MSNSAALFPREVDLPATNLSPILSEKRSSMLNQDGYLCGACVAYEWLKNFRFLLDRLQPLTHSLRSLLQRRAFEPVRQGHRRYSVNMFRCYLFLPEVSRIGLRCPAHHDISAVSIYIEFNVDKRNEFGNLERNSHSFFQLRCSCDAGAELLFVAGILGQKCLGCGLEALSQFNDLNALLDIMDGCDIDTETKAVGKLRA